MMLKAGISTSETAAWSFLVVIVAEKTASLELLLTIDY